MNMNMQAGAILDQRQQPQQQFQLQHAHQAAAIMDPMAVAKAMGQPARSNGVQLRQPATSHQHFTRSSRLVKPEGIDPVGVDSKASAEASSAMKSLMHLGVHMNSPDEPVTPSAVETALMSLVDATTLALVSPAKVKRFVSVLHGAKSEPEQALVLVILRATATSSNAKLAQSCASAFELSGGLKVAKQWLEAAVTWNYSDLLVLLLEVLKRIPLQLTSITEARINEPIVKLRKGAREERVKRAAQELLKYWRTQFTEKDKSPAPAASAATSQAAPASASSSSSSNGNGNASSVAVAKASSPRASAASTPATSDGTSTTAAALSSPPKVSKLVGKLVKRRPIKRLERLPFGGGSAVSKSSGSSELIGNLMQRKAKEAAAAKADGSSPRDSDGSDASDSNAPASTATASGSADEKKETGVSGDVPMELPTIQSFKAAVSAPSTSKKSSKRIRWADDNGQELTKIKLIESWRDMVQYTPHDENSFRDAKLREHADERSMMKSHKDPVRDAFKLTLAHDWRSPALVLLPEALSARQRPLQTAEVHAQSSRTRREMEYLVLDGEVPPPTPKEWAHQPNDLVRGAPFEIPLSDVAEAPPMAVAPAMGGGVLPPAARPVPGGYGEYESEEDRALRDALGPLSKSTVAVLLDHEDAFPQVLDEAQRNGNRIPDARVLEIVDFHRRGRGLPPLVAMGAPPLGVAGPPGFPNKYGSGHRGEPPSMYNRYGGYDGYDGPPAAQAPPMGAGAPYGGKNNGGGGGFGKKRKAPGAFGEAPPPPKRMSKRPCLFFNTARGCKNGAGCAFLHEPAAPNGGPTAGPGPNPGRYGQPMHDMGPGPGPGPRHHFRGGR